MGFLKNLAKNELGIGVSEEEIKAKIVNSDVPGMIILEIANRLLPEHDDEDGNPVEAGDLYSFLNLDNKNNAVWIKCYTDAVSVLSLTTKLVPTGLFKSEVQYDEEESGYNFAKSGIEDLPNYKYAKVLQTYICDELNDIFSSRYEIRELMYTGPINPNAGLIASTVDTRIKITLTES